MLGSAVLFLVACLIRRWWLMRRLRFIHPEPTEQTVKQIDTHEAQSKKKWIDAEPENKPSSPTVPQSPSIPTAAQIADGSRPNSDELPPVLTKRDVMSLTPVVAALDSGGGVAPTPRLNSSRRAAKSIREETFRRIVHSMFILGALFYLRLTTLSLRMFDCVHATGQPELESADGSVVYVESSDQSRQLYLLADLGTRCFTGGHLATAIFALVFLVFFSLMYPVYALILLTRTFAGPHSKGCARFLVTRFACCRGAGYRIKLRRKASIQTVNQDEEEDEDENVIARDGEQATATKTQTELYGYLFRGLRPSLYYYRILLYPLQFLYAAMSTFFPGDSFTIFVLGIGSAMQTFFIVVYLPFTSWAVSQTRIISRRLSREIALSWLSVTFIDAISLTLYVLVCVCCVLCLILVQCDFDYLLSHISRSCSPDLGTVDWRRYATPIWHAIGRLICHTHLLIIISSPIDETIRWVSRITIRQGC